MPIDNIVSILRAPTSDNPSSGSILPGRLDGDEVIELTRIVTEEKVTLPPPRHPRPTLPGRVAIIGNYLPRKCGIATFTTDLCDAMHAEYSATELLALPVNDIHEGYSYPP